MALRTTALILAALALQAAPAGASLERLRGAHTSDFGISSVSAVNGRGDAALAWTARRGVAVAVSRRGRFGRARIVPRSRGVYDYGLAVALGDRGDVVVAWTENDHSIPAEPDSRDDDCCVRAWAAVLRRDGTFTRARRLSRRGDDIRQMAVATGSRGRIALTYVTSAREHVRLRPGTIEGGWGRERVVSRPSFQSGVLALGFARGGATVDFFRRPGHRGAFHVVSRTLAGGRLQPARRLASERFDDLFIPGPLHLLRRRGLMVIAGNGTHALLEQRLAGRPRFFPTDVPEDDFARLRVAPGGAAALIGRVDRRSVVVRARRPGRGFGPARRVQVLPRARSLGRFPADEIDATATRDGRPVVLGLESRRGRTGIWIGHPGRRPRRAGRLRGRTFAADATLMLRGRPAFLISNDGRLYVVRG